jgi:hypothetical protein
MNARLAVVCSVFAVLGGCDGAGSGSADAAPDGGSGSEVASAADGAVDATTFPDYVEVSEVGSGDAGEEVDDTGGAADGDSASSAEAGTDGGPPPDVSNALFSLSLKNADGATTSSLSVTHIAGTSPCPQLLGSVVATNKSGVSGALTVTAQGASGVSFLPAPSVAVPDGASVQVQVVFECGTPTGFSGALLAFVDNGAEGLEATFGVTVTVETPPSTACADPADVAILEATPDVLAIAQMESQACILGGMSEEPELSTCTTNAVADKVGLSVTCATCFGVDAACEKSHCFAKCLVGPTHCEDCRKASGCTFALASCVNAPGLVEPADPCDPNPCSKPPAPQCVGQVAQSFQAVGTCAAVDGAAECTYAKAGDETCANLCVNGHCLGSTSPFDYVFAPTASFMTKAELAPEGCCFDFDGDGKNDNGLASVLAILSQFMEEPIAPVLQDYIDAGELVALFEYRGGVGPPQQTPLEVSALLGQHLGSVATAKTGFGTFNANFDAFDPASGLPRSNLNGWGTASKFSAGPGDGALWLAVAGNIGLGPNGAGVDVWNGKLGGVLKVGAFADAYNAVFADCACLGTSQPIFMVVTSDPARLKLGCSAAFNQATSNCGANTPALCQAIADNKSLLCPALGVLPFDQDIDGDGQKDAMSFGVNFEAVSATIVGVQ